MSIDLDIRITHTHKKENKKTTKTKQTKPRKNLTKGKRRVTWNCNG